jgi:putative nucleotidyltransferase with HDIG domain
MRARSLNAYVSTVIAIGAIAVAFALYGSTRTSEPLAWLAFAALAIVAGSFKLNFAAVSASISVSDTFFIAAALLFGPSAGTAAIALDSLVISARRKDPWQRLGFNVAAPALSLFVGSQVGFLVAGAPPIAESHAPVGTLAAPLLTLVVIYYLLNSGLTAVAIALESRRPALEIWTRHFMWLSVGYLGAASAAFCLILLVQQVSLAAAIMVLPLLAVFYLTLRSSFGRLEDAQKHVTDLDRLYRSTVETLAMAIDAKDDVTHSHVRRVQTYALALARSLGIDEERELRAIEAAALLHDTGKLAVPEHILNKPGKLTEAEFEQMKLHVDVGADILSLVDFPYPVVPIVRCHHENWDGTGYPRGVTGEDIPLGARILSVVDCFDALTSDRPYRRRITDEEAFEILNARRGSMYDPAVVDTFAAIYRDIRLPREQTVEQQQVMRRISPKPVSGTVDAPPLSNSSGAPHDLLAFVSLARMARAGASREDVLTLASTLVGRYVPAASGAWYLVDARNDRLHVASAFGGGAAGLRGLTVSIGERLTGWVAATHQAIVDSDAALDLGDVDGRTDPALTRCTSVPLMVGQTLIGALTLYAPSSQGLGDDRGRWLEMLAPHLGTALQAAAPAAAAATEAETAPAGVLNFQAARQKTQGQPRKAAR